MENILTNIMSSDINIFNGLVLLLIAIPLSMAGGAIGGIILAGKEFGYNFSAMIGSLFAPIGAVTGVTLGLILLYIWNHL